MFVEKCIQKSIWGHLSITLPYASETWPMTTPNQHRHCLDARILHHSLVTMLLDVSAARFCAGVCASTVLGVLQHTATATAAAEAYGAHFDQTLSRLACGDA